MVAMQWLALILWLLIAPVGMLLGVFALSTPGAALQAPAVVAGLGLTVVYLITDSPAAAWGGFAAAVLAFVTTGAAGAWLVSGDREVSAAGQTAEETQAAIAGWQLPLLVVVSLAMLLVALDLVVA
jgi:hypothetical protein